MKEARRKTKAKSIKERATTGKRGKGGCLESRKGRRRRHGRNGLMPVISGCQPVETGRGTFDFLDLG
jgi:hypothetical protein